MEGKSLNDNPNQPLMMSKQLEDEVENKKRKNCGLFILFVTVVFFIIATVLYIVKEEEEHHDIRDDQDLLIRHPLPANYVDGTATGIRAICNDDSEATYFFRKNNGTDHAKKFVIYVPGGSGCWDAETCDERWDVRPDDMRGDPATKKLGRGVTNSDTVVGLNSFRHWNMAWLTYCSSDGFMGRVDKNDPENKAPKWHFGGDAIFWGAFQGLLDVNGMKDAEHILITASSAGAGGTLQQMDRLKAHLQAQAPNANIKFAYDNGWHVFNVNDTYVSPIYEPGQEHRTRNAMFHGWKANVNDDCRAAYAGEDEWKCMYTADIVYPHMKTKDFHMHMHMYDFMQHSGYGILPAAFDTWDEATLEFSRYLAHILVDSMKATDPTVTSFTSPACREHDDFDKSGWAMEHMQTDPYGGDYDRRLPVYIMNFMINHEVFRSWDRCMEPYCNPTCATLPYDDPNGLPCELTHTCVDPPWEPPV